MNGPAGSLGHRPGAHHYPEGCRDSHWQHMAAAVVGGTGREAAGGRCAAKGALYNHAAFTMGAGAQVRAGGWPGWACGEVGVTSVWQ